MEEKLRRIVFHGNNAWTDPHDRRQTRQVLTELHELGVLDRTEVLGYATANARHGRHGLKHLEAMLDSVLAPRDTRNRPLSVKVRRPRSGLCRP